MIDSIIEFSQSHQNEISLLTAFGTLLISTVSLIIAFFAISTQRKHDQLSVRPFAHIFMADYQDNVYVGVENVGLGPMEIISISFVNKSGNTINKLIQGMPQLKHGITWKTFSTNIEGYIFSPSRSMKFIQISGDENDPHFMENREAVRKTLSQYKVHISYKDVYNNKYSRECDLSWFSKDKVS